MDNNDAQFIYDQTDHDDCFDNNEMEGWISEAVIMASQKNLIIRVMILNEFWYKGTSF